MYEAYLTKTTLTFLGTLVGVSGSPEDIKRLSGRGVNTWERYGAPVLLCIRGSMEHYMQVDYLLGSDDEDLMKYREAYLTECNMVAVAAAITAQGGFSGLQLDSVYTLSWTCRGAFVFSLVAGLFAVYAACCQQRLMTNLTRPDQLRFWLTANSSDHSEIHVDHHGGGITKVFSDGSRAIPSLPTVLTLTAPRTLLDCSIRCFLIGLGIYLASIFADNDLSASRTGNMWTMITYFIAICVGLSLFISPSSYKNFSQARDREEQLQREEVKNWNEKGTWNEPETTKGPDSSVDSSESLKGARVATSAHINEQQEAMRRMELALQASAAAHQQSARDLLAAAEICRKMARG